MLRAALAWARRARWISGDLPYLELPTQPRPRERFLNRDEADRLLACAAMHHVKVFLALCLYTAGRSGAIRELTWDRVDLTTGLIDLGQAVGGKGRAVVPIADRLRPILEDARTAATCPYVVEYDGAPVASLKTGTRAAARRAGLAGVTPHVLRHTAATWMVEAGIPIEQVAQMLGHRDPRVTWRIYAKHAPDYLREAVNALNG
jgi:integrase